MTETLLGVLFALLAAIAFGSSNVLIRLALEHVETMTGVFISLVAGSVLTLTVALVMDAQAIFAVTLAALPGFALMAFLEFLMGRNLIFAGIRLAGVALASVFLGTEPIFAALFANIFLSEQITLLIAIGIFAVVVGIAIVMTAPQLQDSEPEPPDGIAFVLDSTRGERQALIRRRLLLGVLAATLPAAAFATTRILARYLVLTVAPPQVGAMYTAFFGTLYVFGLTGRKLGRLRHAPRTALVTVAIAGITIASGSMFVFFAVSAAPVTVVSPVLQLTTLVGIALAHFFLKRLERVTFRLVSGACLVFAGVVLVILGG